jgi:FtsZ-binding cell division protein ZapB
MADAQNRDSPPVVPPKEPIEAKITEPNTDPKTKGEPPSSHQRESKIESQEKSCSPEKRSHKLSPRSIPGGWNDDETNEPVLKGYETIEQGSQAQKGMAKPDLMELDNSVTTLITFDDATTHQSQSQSPPLRRTGLLPTSEEFQSLDHLAGFENDSLTHPDDKVKEENILLQRHIQDLHRKLSALSTDRQIAEEKADRLSEKVDSMKQRMSSSMTEVERSSEALATKVEELTEENRALREQLNDAQSHIFSLQPYRKDLTPEEVGQV